MNTPPNMIHVAPLHALDVVKELRPDAPVHLIELDDPVAFVKALPPHLQTPTQWNPNAGLPPNAWCGVTLDGHASMKRAGELLSVRARVLWVHFKDASWTETTRLFVPWRCPRCGQRGKPSWLARRPENCSSSAQLCGDAKLEPQIHWLILDQTLTPLAEDVRGLGGLVWPSEIPDVHPLEFKEAARRLDNPPPRIRGVP
jgi:hypothetical protein